VGFAFRSVDDPGDAVFEVKAVEVDQIAEGDFGQTKIVLGGFFEELRDQNH
jgi:hypothetical protein